MPKPIANRPSAEELRSMYESGMSTVQIANVINVGKSTVWEWMQKHSIDRRPNRVVTVPSKAKLEELYRSGMSLTEIAKYASDLNDGRNICHKTVLYWFSKHQIQTRTLSTARSISLKKNPDQLKKFQSAGVIAAAAFHTGKSYKKQLARARKKRKFSELRINRNCGNPKCGVVMSLPPHLAKRRGKFCSRSCAITVHNHERKLQRIANQPIPIPKAELIKPDWLTDAEWESLMAANANAGGK